jgi:hypothetical protein
MPTRLTKAPTKPVIQAPKTSAEWHQLMLQVISRAGAAKSKLLPGLRDALAKGKTEPFLRRLGIIHKNDIERLFPNP